MSTAAIRLDASERWLGPVSPIGRASRTMMLIALASLAGHLLVVATAVVGARSPPVPRQEISVEVVQDIPKPAPDEPKSTPEEQKASEPAKRAEAAAPPAAKAAAPPAAKPEPPRPEPPPAPKAEPAKSQPPRKTAAAPPPRTQPQVEAEEQKLAALQKELESLRAEQASLQAEHADAEAAARAPTPLRDAGLGPLPDSFQAVALPSASDGAGEAVSYQEIVFSALAKAKGFGRTKGLPGSAGVRFSVDSTGRLVDLELVHGSGVPSLDAQALDIVRRAAPFPAPPQGAQRSFSANVNFVTGAQ